MSAAPEIAKLGHVAFVTPDLETSLWFFRDVVGLHEVARDGDRVYLRAWGEFEHHSLVLMKGETARVDHIGWRVRRPEDMEKFARMLEENGIHTTYVSAGEEVGQGEGIRFETPKGHHFELYYQVQKELPPGIKRSRLKNNPLRPWDHGISPRRIDHVNIWTDEPGALQAWLEGVLGFKTREFIRLESGQVVGAWMSVTPQVHDVGVMKDPKGQPNRFHHVAYYLDNWQDVLRGLDILREHGIVVDHGPGRHGISQAFFTYVRDPGSGHRIELFSGGYLIFDPDWEPIEWTEGEMEEALTWWGSRRQPEGPMSETTLC